MELVNKLTSWRRDVQIKLAEQDVVSPTRRQACQANGYMHFSAYYALEMHFVIQDLFELRNYISVCRRLMKIEEFIWLRVVLCSCLTS